MNLGVALLYLIVVVCVITTLIAISVSISLIKDNRCLRRMIKEYEDDRAECM